MNIRKAKQQDIETLTKMVIEICRLEAKIEPCLKALDRSQFKEFKKYIKDGIMGKKGSFVLVAEEKGKIIGFVYGEIKKRPPVFKTRKVGEIADIFVAPKHRKKGIARQLLEEAAKIFRKRKLKYVCLTALAGNTAALKAYSKAGFKECAKELWKEIWTK